MTALTAELGRFVSELSLDQIPAEALAMAKTGIADCVGVMIAGSRDPVVALIDKELSGTDGAALASLIPAGGRRNVEDAALVNGAAAHVLDYDDVTLDGHPSAVLVPTLLAQGEAVNAAGPDLLAAYVAGYEVWAELLVREPVPLHQKGWHPTTVRGVVASAAAAARLLRLDAAQCRTALAIAASLAGGLVANFGSLTKCFQVGRAAQSGIIAARLARAGLTASPDTLEHQSGFLAALSPDGRADLKRSFDPAHKEWHLATKGLNIKRYPICYATHRAIDAALDLATAHDIGPAQVERIEVATGEMQMLMLRNARPKTAFEAKFSMQFAMASALIARAVGLAQLRDDFVGRNDVQDLIGRVAITTTKETMNDSAFALSETVEIVLRGGRRHASEPVVYAKGSMQKPLDNQELYAKFDDCLGEGFGGNAKAALFDRLMTLERCGGAVDLVASIRQ